MALIKAFFNERCLFDKNVKDPHVIMNIKTRTIAPQNVNVNVVHKIGTHIIQSMIGKHPFDVTIKKAGSCRADTCKVYFKNSSEMQYGQFTAGPQLLFQRALNLASSEEVNITLHECLS